MEWRAPKNRRKNAAYAIKSACHIAIRDRREWPVKKKKRDEGSR
jgi:hypothetical protein